MMAAWVESEWLAFDLETTGIDKHHDVPVSFALVTLEGGEVVASRYSVVDPGRRIPEGAAAVHGISTEQAQAEGITLEEAVGEIAGVLVDASKRGVPVVGFNLSYDLTMMDACCRRLDGRGLVERGWAGPVLDPLVMDKELVRFRKGSGSRKLERLIVEFGITNEAAHDARGDAVASALLLRKFAEKYPEVGEVDLDQLYVNQAQWNTRWAGEFNDYLMRNGKPGFKDEEFEWPLQIVTEGRLF